MATAGPKNFLEKYADLFTTIKTQTIWESVVDFVTPKNPHIMAAIFMNDNGIVCPAVLDLIDPPQDQPEPVKAEVVPSFKSKF